MKRAQLTQTVLTVCSAAEPFKTLTGPSYQNAPPISKAANAKRTISAI